VAPKAGEFRIKMVATGVCHTDDSGLAGKFGDIFPVFLAHEGGGVIESVGEGVTTVKPGVHVILLWMARCDECSICKNPQTNVFEIERPWRIQTCYGESC